MRNNLQSVKYFNKFNTLKVLISALVIIFFGVLSIFYFSGFKKIEGLGVYFINTQTDNLDFIVQNDYQEKVNCEINAFVLKKILLKEKIIIEPFEIKKLSIEKIRFVKGEKNIVNISCDTKEGIFSREIYKYIK